MTWSETVEGCISEPRMLSTQSSFQSQQISWTAQCSSDSGHVYIFLLEVQCRFLLEFAFQVVCGRGHTHNDYIDRVLGNFHWWKLSELAKVEHFANKTFVDCRPHTFPVTNNFFGLPPKCFLIPRTKLRGRQQYREIHEGFQLCGNYSSAPDKVLAPFAYRLTCAEEMLYCDRLALWA